MLGGRWGGPILARLADDVTRAAEGGGATQRGQGWGQLQRGQKRDSVRKRSDETSKPSTQDRTVFGKVLRLRLSGW